MSEPNLAKEIPQVSRRARAYRLEDNGAADLAHRKRELKDSIANARRAIERIRSGKDRYSSLPPLDAETVERLVGKHYGHIQACEEKIAELRPGSSLIAPVARRVAREDRRRKRKAMQNPTPTPKDNP